ncbi:MAG: hypothetical protein WA677_26055 [Bradyrhizobium sp.]
MPGARCARSLVCEIKKHTSVVTTVTPETPGIPRAMVLTAYFVLPGDRALLPPSLADSFANLMPASGHQDHTTSPSAYPCIRLMHDKRPSHPRPTFVTMRNAPLGGHGTAGLLKLICPTTQVHIFRMKAGWSNQLEWIFDFAFLPVSALSIPAF